MKHRVTLTSTGRISSARLVGTADALTGLARQAEVWHRFRRQHGRLGSAFLLCVALRRGVSLSGPVVGCSR
ncbi:hypothetical protein [Micromonospora sp. NPDC047730]|uniref:hypothetical protein n=1 Tax=Micromonospora sp. NPDC047730 TaxID=3364253 RepID=UPI003719D6A9